ncbi:hypothetical protein B0T26DRAFT_693037, partial [Lasiosphaeria miniovina]
GSCSFWSFGRCRFVCVCFWFPAPFPFFFLLLLLFSLSRRQFTHTSHVPALIPIDDLHLPLNRLSPITIHPPTFFPSGLSIILVISPLV